MPNDLREVAAQTTVSVIFPVRYDVTVLTAMPLVALSDIAVEAFTIGT